MPHVYQNLDGGCTPTAMACANFPISSKIGKLILELTVKAASSYQWCAAGPGPGEGYTLPSTLTTRGATMECTGHAGFPEVIHLASSCLLA